MTLQKTRPGVLPLLALLLLVPLVAMQFTDEVNWTLFDFVVMGFLLAGAAGLLELVLRKVARRDYRLLFGLAILAGFLLVWAELAVGIFGTPFAGS